MEELGSDTKEMYTMYKDIFKQTYSIRKTLKHKYYYFQRFYKITTYGVIFTLLVEAWGGKTKAAVS